MNEFSSLTAVHIISEIVAAKVGTVPGVGTTRGLRGTLKSLMSVSLARHCDVPGGNVPPDWQRRSLLLCQFLFLRQQVEVQAGRREELSMKAGR